MQELLEALQSTDYLRCYTGPTIPTTGTVGTVPVDSVPPLPAMGTVGTVPVDSSAGMLEASETADGAGSGLAWARNESSLLLPAGGESFGLGGAEALF